MTQEFDLIVIGAGTGGVGGARMAASVRLKLLYMGIQNASKKWTIPYKTRI